MEFTIILQILIVCLFSTFVIIVFSLKFVCDIIYQLAKKIVEAKNFTLKNISLYISNIKSKKIYDKLKCFIFSIHGKFLLASLSGFWLVLSNNWYPKNTFLGMFFAFILLLCMILIVFLFKILIPFFTNIGFSSYMSYFHNSIHKKINKIIYVEKNMINVQLLTIEHRSKSLFSFSNQELSSYIDRLKEYSTLKSVIRISLLVSLFFYFFTQFDSVNEIIDFLKNLLESNLSDLKNLSTTDILINALNMFIQLPFSLITLYLIFFGIPLITFLPLTIDIGIERIPQRKAIVESVLEYRRVAK